MIEEAKVEELFVKVKRHRRLSSGGTGLGGGGSIKHPRSASNKERRGGRHASVSPLKPSEHNRQQSLTLDLDSFETEYHEEALSNCSTKKIIAKPVSSPPADLKLVAYIKRFVRLYGKAPQSSLEFYRLGGLVGKGAFSAVYSAVSKLTNVTVALKAVEKSALVDPRRARKLTQEMEILRLTRHPHLVKLYELIETPSHLYFVLEFLSGGTLLSLVQTTGKLTEKAAKPLFLHICLGLKALHEHSIVHRDIKLDNMLFEESLAKLCDFGASKAVRAGERLVDRVGTPAYLAPEVVSDRDYEGRPADMWSLGVSLYGLLCGTLPFKGFNSSALHKAIDAGVYPLPSELSRPAKDLLSRLLTHDPAKRPSVTEVLAHTWLREAMTPHVPVADIDSLALLEAAKVGFPPELVLASVRVRDMTMAAAVYEMLSDRRT